jgi:hypothetical protein
MSRWPVLTVLMMLPMLGGCGTAVRPGLANAPRLGGATAADDRVTDTVANGADACGLYAEHGVLRNQIPACASWAPTFPPASYATPVASAPNGGLVEPWVNHLYVGWPCPRTSASRQTKSWSVPGAALATCTETVP